MMVWDKHKCRLEACQKCCHATGIKVKVTRGSSGRNPLKKSMK